jgi:hypothetical protein
LQSPAWLFFAFSVLKSSRKCISALLSMQLQDCINPFRKSGPFPEESSFSVGLCTWEISVQWEGLGMCLKQLKFPQLHMITKGFAQSLYLGPAQASLHSCTDRWPERKIAGNHQITSELFSLENFSSFYLHCFPSSQVLLKMTFVIFSICSSKSVDLAHPPQHKSLCSF